MANNFKKNKLIKIGKKGIIDNFLALLITLGLLIIIFGALYLFMYAKMKENDTIFTSDINNKEGLYTTRMLLNQEISPGYRVYELIINTVNGGDQATFEKDMGTAIQRFYPNGQVNEDWRIIVNNECYMFAQGTTTQVSGKIVVNLNPVSPGPGAAVPIPKIIDLCDKNEINLMPRVTVPNPDGTNILVLFKPSKPADKINGRIFGYRADQMKGILGEDIPKYAIDGRNLERIENIPNINCDESATVVGKICAADTELVEQLKKISANELQSTGMRIEITQAYRTYDIQKRLYSMNCGSGSCSPPTCDPDTSYLCPHMQAGAIDLNLFDKDGNNLNDKNPQAVEDLMCKYGFLRLKSEDWHFEYNTNKWDEIQAKYVGVTKPCNY